MFRQVSSDGPWEGMSVHYPTWREAMDFADREGRPDPGIGEAMTTLRVLTTSDAEVAAAVMNAARLVAAGATDRQVMAFMKIVAQGRITHQDLAVLASTGIALPPMREGARR